MTDEPMVQNAEGAETLGETNNPEPTATENPVEDVSPDQSADETEIPEVKSERGQNRVQQLANKAREAEETVKKVQEEKDSLRAELNQITQPEPSPVKDNPVFPWMKTEEQKPSLGAEVTPEQYWQHVESEAMRKAETIVDLKLKEQEQKAKIERNYQKDISDLENQYADVFSSNDPDLKTEFKRQFNLYQKTLRVDPDVRFKDFAGPLLKARSLGVEQGKSQAVETLSQQVSQTAVKPTTERTNQLTTEESLIEAMRSGKISAAEAEARIAKLQ